jgi:hypothetical protein
VRTPWKTLHDAGEKVIGLDLDAADSSGRVSTLLYMVVVFLPIVLAIGALNWAMNALVPDTHVTEAFNDNFFVVVGATFGVFFFYSFFRRVYDGLREPTVTTHNPEQTNG